jgi:hypothetical protein
VIHAVRPSLEQHRQPIRILDRQRPQQHGVEEAEDHRRQRNAERQRADGHAGHQRTTP